MTEETPKYLITSTASVSGTFTYAAAKVSETYPRHYRLAKTHTGRTILQGAYYWQCGSDGGFDWRKIPTVQLRADGTVVE